MSSEPGTIRAQPPDVIVAVGSGDAMEEFPCYKVSLSFAAEYFDVMLSTAMVEGETSRISFPDKDPDAWREFYKQIDPAHAARASKPELTMDNVQLLVPWFHQFDMQDYLRKSDEVVARYIEGIQEGKDSSFWAKPAPPQPVVGFVFGSGVANRRREERKRTFAEIIHLFQFSMSYNLPDSSRKADEMVENLLYSWHRAADLFGPDVIKSLVPYMVYKSDGVQDQGECVRMFFQELMQPLVTGEGNRDFEWFVSDEYIENNKGWCITPELASNSIFPLLVHTRFQQRAGEEQKGEVEREKARLQNENDVLRTEKRTLLDKNDALRAEKRKWLNDMNAATKVLSTQAQMFAPPPPPHPHPSFHGT